MMTLDEAIAHAKEVAKANRDKAEGYSRGEDYEQIKADECAACAEEHEQLVSWLEELKRYKAQKLVIKVDYDKARSLKEMLRYAEFGIACPDSQYEVIPLASDRPQGEWEDVICEKGGFYHATCSNCKIRNDIPPVDFAHFCPNCGADMRGGDRE